MTRDQLQINLNRRVGPAAGLADFDEAVSYALVSCGVPPDDEAAIIDADLALVLPGDSNKFKDVAEWRMVEAILMNATAAALLALGIDEDPDKFSARLRAAKSDLYSRIKDQYSFGIPTLQIGVISLDISQDGDEYPAY